tara:strand:- start:969 stop:1334 length:366 start_codon:yes stop_codon:yes gene_type:complete
MKKLILISLLLFSFNGWAEEEENMIYLNCINEDKILSGNFLVVDLDRMLLSSKTAFEWKMTSNNSYYFAEFRNNIAIQLYTLNRVTLRLTFTITQLNDSGKPDLTQPVAYMNYNCERTERI